MRPSTRHDAHSPRVVIFALGLAGLFVAATAATATPVYVDSGQSFGPKKGHYGRCNAWADFDGNGLYDVVIGGADDGLKAYYQESPMVFRRVDTEVGLGSYGLRPLYADLALDFDRDGDPDIVLSQVGFDYPDGMPTLRFLQNDGTGHFAERTTTVGFSETDRSFGLAAFDYDRDGWLDLYVLHHDAPNALYHNLGDGTFEDVTAQAGVAAQDGREGWSTGLTTLDYDRDGWVDLFVAQRDDLSDVYPRGNNKLYHNQGDGTFVDRAVEAGVQGYSHDFVVGAADLDSDGWMDLYTGTFNFAPSGTPSTDFPNRTYLNQGDGTFVDVSLGSGADYIGGTMGLAIGDADSDGDPDLYVGTGGPFDAQIEDQIFYLNDGTALFGDHALEAGLVNDARGHGSSTFDFDRDGDLDIYASLGGLTVGSERKDILYLNQGPNGHYLEVLARGVDCPLEGVGVSVECFFAGTSLRREIQATGGFDSQAPPHAWFGLGASTAIDSLVVEWPCGRRQVLHDVAADNHLSVTEASTEVAVRDLALSAARNGSAGVRLRVGPVGDVDPQRAVELRRRIGSSAWRLRGLDWHRQGTELVADDPSVPRDQDVSYRVRVLADPEAAATWVERETQLTGSRLRLDLQGNPFRQRVALHAVGVGATASLRIYDLRGRLVRKMDWSDATRSGAEVIWTWNGRDESGTAVASGAYVVDLQDGGHRVQRSVWKSPN